MYLVKQMSWGWAIFLGYLRPVQVAAAVACKPSIGDPPDKAAVRMLRRRGFYLVKP